MGGGHKQSLGGDTAPWFPRSDGTGIYIGNFRYITEILDLFCKRFLFQLRVYFVIYRKLPNIYRNIGVAKILGLGGRGKPEIT